MKYEGNEQDVSHAFHKRHNEFKKNSQDSSTKISNTITGKAFMSSWEQNHHPFNNHQ